MLFSLPIVPIKQRETSMDYVQVISLISDTAGFHLVERRVEGNHFSFGATWTHKHCFYRISEDRFTQRVTMTD